VHDPLVILTVCLGNICRSPTAEAAVRDAARRAGLAVEVRSAGTGTWHLGEPPDERMTRAAAQHGLTLEGRAERVDAAALAAADLVLVMDRDNLADVHRLAEQAGITTPIHLLRDFDAAAGPGAEVPDPYLGDAQAFATVVDICRRSADGVVEHLRRLSGTAAR